MLIVENGSTKAAWRLLKEEKLVQAFDTSGFSPTNTDYASILSTLSQAREKLGAVDHIICYSTGAGHPDRAKRLQDAFQDIFSPSRLKIEHDLTAAARSTRREKGLVCILGTGSHSALHEHGEVIHSIGGLGYLIGDEGSGADLGRHFLQAMLLGQLPAHIIEYFEAQEGKKLRQWMSELYQTPRPNVRLAALTHYLSYWKKEASIADLVIARFRLFLDKSILQYPQFDQLPLDAVGSIAHHFQDFWTEACRQQGLTPAAIIANPIDTLIFFHLENDYGQN